MTLDTPYSIFPPTSVASSDFQRAAGFSFIDYLGFSTCRGNGDAIVPTPLAGNGTSVSVLSLSVVSSSPTSTAVSSQPSAQISPAQPHLDSKAKAGIGISVPIALAGLVFLGFFAWRKCHKSSIMEEIDEKKENAETSQPYLQPKAELEAEEKRKHELEAEQRRYELDGEGEIHEVYAGDSQAKAPVQTRQELRGEEHSKELEAPR